MSLGTSLAKDDKEIFETGNNLQGTTGISRVCAGRPESAHSQERQASSYHSMISNLGNQAWSPGSQEHHGTKGRKRRRSERAHDPPMASNHRGSCSTKEEARLALLEQYLNREQAFHTAVIAAAQQKSKMLADNESEFDNFIRHNRIDRPSAQGAINAGSYPRFLTKRLLPRSKLDIFIPSDKSQQGSRLARELRISKKDRDAQAEQIDELVPIRLDIEWDQIRLRDTFTWNMHDRVLGIEQFSYQLFEDFRLDLPSLQSESLVRQIQSSIQEQINDFHPHVYIEEDALDPHLPYAAYKNDEMRIIIKLNITIGQYTLVDQFEWDVNNPMNSPEDFAIQMTRELSLSGEFTTAIAHSIREQSQLFTHSLYVVGHPFDGRPIEDHELLASFQPSPLPSAFRPYQAAKEFTPCLYELNDAELEKTELSLSREERRQKRSVNRRGGPALPDLKDRRRTIRTLLVSSVLPGAAESIQESRIFKRTAATGKGRKGPLRDGYDEFDDSESDESILGSPAASAHPYSSTARTRGTRGAASVAQVAMRANIGRSATPELAIQHHHETRASGRKVVRDDSTPEPQLNLVVVLRLPPLALRHLHVQSADPTDTTVNGANPVSRQGVFSAHPVQGIMGPPLSMPQVNSPHSASGFRHQAPAAPSTSKHGSTSHLGRVSANGPPGQDHPSVRHGNGAAFLD